MTAATGTGTGSLAVKMRFQSGSGRRRDGPDRSTWARDARDARLFRASSSLRACRLGRPVKDEQACP